jgi:opacity protein-like surface antigen
MFQLSVRRAFSIFVLLLITGPASQAFSQTIRNLDGALSVFGQFSGTSNGNGIEDKPTYSSGVLATGRQSLHFWLGWELNYSYTRYAERFKAPTYGIQVQDNMHEVTGAYLVQGPTIPLLGLQPFGAVGVGALVFLPTTVGGQRYNQQTRVPILYEVGVNYPILTSHLGLRLQYRGLSYKTPDYNAEQTTTGSRRQTSEPSLGAYFRF